MSSIHGKQTLSNGRETENRLRDASDVFADADCAEDANDDHADDDDDKDDAWSVKGRLPVCR